MNVHRFKNESQSRRCPSCKAHVSDQDRICPVCGDALSAAAQPTKPAAKPASGTLPPPEKSREAIFTPTSNPVTSVTPAASAEQSANVKVVTAMAQPDPAAKAAQARVTPQQRSLPRRPANTTKALPHGGSDRSVQSDSYRRDPTTTTITATTTTTTTKINLKPQATKPLMPSINIVVVFGAVALLMVGAVLLRMGANARSNAITAAAVSETQLANVTVVFAQLTPTSMQAAPQATLTEPATTIATPVAVRVISSTAESSDSTMLLVVPITATETVVPTETATATTTSTPTPEPTKTSLPTATAVPPTATSRPTATPKPTFTPLPTATSLPTQTPRPTSTPQPTETPLPTATAVPPTATPQPTETPLPTATLHPSSTFTPPPTSTPLPTSTAVPPTATPQPTDTLVPTVTAQPTSTATQVPTRTPLPVVQDGALRYAVTAGDTCLDIANRFGVSLARLAAYNQFDEKTCFLNIGQIVLIPPAVSAAATVARPTATAIPIATATAIPTAPPAATATADAPADAQTTYTVRDGDTCGSIAKRFGIRVAQLVAANGLNAEVCFLRAGQKLIITSSTALPGQQTYVVKPGDSCLEIATRYKITVNRLAAANNLNPKTCFLSVGRKLIIP